MDAITDEINEAVIDLVLDGKIALTGFFDRHGMVDDGCERHVFFSSYQKDILRRVERNLSGKGYTCRVTVSSSHAKSSGHINYTTRVPHPMKKLLTWSTLMLLPIIATVTALQYSTYFRNNSRASSDLYSHRGESLAAVDLYGWKFDTAKVDNDRTQVLEERVRRSKLDAKMGPPYIRSQRSQRVNSDNGTQQK